ELLIDCESRVVVISPKLTAGLERLRNLGKIFHINRKYRFGDLEGAFVVICATDDQRVNLKAYKEAIGRGILVNVVDDPDLCNFILPSTVKRGDLTIAISTSGSCPALAKKIREDLEEIFGSEYAEYVNLLRRLREKLIEDVPDTEKRNLILKKLICSDILELIKTEKRDLIEERIKECFSS
ncbi:MAG: bifunctional precorrin-2 dehydrogenase/sirohydrochlorin ferrochelatase, partial [Candidatus Subteraquimicrobiales bacterium]|nr:bifunctional precorrin-2 dehydrogenase/sirohydrochlorin ferrochelatase [Candidatus Subteraquimicrobiales bacterium]